MGQLTPDVAESLAAAYDLRGEIHADLCTLYTGGLDEPGCTCGIPRLLADLAAALLGQREPVPAGAPS